MREAKQYPVVMRMQGISPSDISGYEAHRMRKGGDLGHVDPTRSAENHQLIGGANWAQKVRDEIDEMKAHNFALELEKLRMRRRKAEAERRIVEGPKDPWRATRHGPMREIILTANKEWFSGFDPDNFEDAFGETRQTRFETLAVAWLKEHFGEDLVHARADLDEEAYHIHAVVLPRSTTQDGRRMLQPSKHEMIRDYERAQDSVGEWFEGLGLTRGVQRAKATREAQQHNRSLRNNEDVAIVPEHVEHVSPADWRRAQERKLADKEKSLAGKEKTLREVMTVATAVAKGDTSLLDQPGKPSSKAPNGVAQRLFGKALANLKVKAQEEAREDVGKALKEIRDADRLIVEMARHLPETARKAIEALRPSLAAPLTRIGLQVKSWSNRKRDRDRQK